MGNYKLYHTINGYKCKVNYAELIFLFAIAENLSADQINAEIIPFNYYVQEDKGGKK